MDALDGNAIAGVLYEYFGREMTMTEGRCGHCRNVSMVAQLRVYMKAPGAVARCRVCGNVVMVIVDVRGNGRVDTSHIEMMSSD
jgi:hypothetical protein